MNARSPLCCLMPAIACVAIALAADVGAQTAAAGSGPAWPARPIRLIVPFPPGGATDANARIIAKEMETIARPTARDRQSRRRERHHRLRNRSPSPRPTATP